MTEPSDAVIQALHLEIMKASEVVDKAAAEVKDLWIRGTTEDMRPPSQVYIKAVVVAYNTVELIGWASLGYVVDEAEYRRAQDCYVLPAHELQPMETLP